MNEVQVNSQGNVQSVDFTSQEPIQPQRSSQTEMMVTRQAQEVQVAMLAAKKFPRDQVVAYNNIMRACQRRKLAESSMYEFPRGNEKITGPSIRLAEAIAQNWGNIDFGFMELEQRNGASQVMAYAWDLETNSRQTKLFSVPHPEYANVVNGEATIVDEQPALPMNAPLLECSEQDASEADNSSSDSENTSNEEIIDNDDTNGASGGTESSDDDYEYDEE